MLKLSGLVVLLAVAVVLILAISKPATYRVERSIAIAAPPDRINALTADFHNWKQWSPWEGLDPNMQTTYSGPSSGPGAVYEWEGNRKVGKGRMEVISATPEMTAIRLDFLKPFESHNLSTFAVAPAGDHTQVTWSMEGPNSFTGKLMSVFTSMDPMMGKDFEKGLQNLKDVAEHPGPQ